MSYTNKNHLAVASIMFASILCSVYFVIFGSNSALAVSASITTASSITLDATSAGTGVSIDEESINITTTCTRGYDLTIATSASPALYLNGDNTTTAVFNAVNGTSALSSNDNTNKWGYTLTNNASGSTVFSPLSTSASSLRTISGTTGTTNETFSIYYGVKTDSTVAPGSYSMGSNGVITYYLTMNPLCNVVDIAYDGNNADAGTMGAAGTGVIHTGVKDGDTVNLIASNFSRSGYGFAGWSTDQNAGAKLIDNDNTNNPVVYGPQESVTLPEGFIDNDTDNDGIVKLYAVWIQSQGNLQGWIGCNDLDTATYDSTTGKLDLTKNSVTALTDQRDNDTYAVARLADGKCWMIENLRLESTNSDNSTGTLAQGYGGQFAGLADAEPAWANEITTANSLYYSGTQDGTATINIGTGSNPAYRFPRYNHDNTNSRASSPTANSAAMYSYGNYYTWPAAIADTTAYTTNNQSVANTSLCPAGWHLPKGGNKNNFASSEFWTLSRASIGADPVNYGSSTWPYYTGTPERTEASNKMRSYPLNFVYSGNVYSGSMDYRGYGGSFWSSTASSSVSAYYLSLDSSSVFPGTGVNGKYYGRTIRCVASDPETFTLAYSANGGTGAPSSPEPIYANGSATFTISSTTPTRSGYTFAGWTDEKGNEVQPSSSFSTKDPNATLYARWTNNSCNPTATTIGTGNTTTDAVCLQDVTPSMKSSLPTADATTGTYTLIDARDGQSYTVAKLADGNLWLTKNLNYGSSNDTLLTSYDTDLPVGTTFKAPASTTSFETSNNDTTYVSPKILTDSTYGGYYSYASAIASTAAYSASGQNITTSICPKGWDLPTSTQYNSLRTISGNTTFAKMSAAPYSFIYAGYRNGTSFTTQTTALRLWTSTNYSASYAYYTTAYNTASYSSNYKRYGESVRCVASNGTGTIRYNANGGTGTMPDQTGDINAMTINSNAFTPASDHKQFREWCTNANGTGTCVAPGASVSSVGLTDGGTVNLYAQWNDVYILTFVNTALTSGNIRTKTVVVGQSSTVAPSSTWSRTGYKLIGWDTVVNDASGSTGTAVYTNAQSITPTSDMTFYTVWRPTYSITYNINTTDVNAAGTMGNQTNIGEGDSITLLASNFSRTGYGFAGWSLDSNAATNTSAKIYGPSETITAPAYPGTNTLTLYAVWVQSAGSIQNASTVSSICNSLTTAPTNGTANISSVSALTDQRDNQTYAIAKLADGKCWMIENLRLESTNSDNSTGTLAQGYGTSATYGNFSGLADAEPAWANNSTTANSLYYSGTQSGTATINIGTGSNPGYRFPRYNHDNTNSRASSPTANSAAMYSYGNYYTWPAAIADTNAYTTNNQSVANTSLCPAGWHLPTGGGAYASGNTGGVNVTGDISTYREFYNLSYKIMDEVKTAYEDTPNGQNSYYSSNTTNNAGDTATKAFRKYPNNFVYSGYVVSGSVGSRGSNGLFWSSTAYSSDYAYFLYLYSSTVYPGTNRGYKYLGGAVRCVADTAIRYFPNATGVTDTMDDQTISSSDNSVTLWASNFQRADYGFAGWSTKPLTINDSDNILRKADIPSDTIIYGPNETISDTATINKIKSEGLDLYAVWIHYSEPDYMQGWAQFDRCNELNIGDVTALLDYRDDNVYTVAKLADGNCWMIENLRLENTAIDNTTGQYAQGYASNFRGLANPETANFSDSTIANSLYSIDGSTAAPAITGSYQGYRFPRYNNQNTSAPVANMTAWDNNSNVYSVGNWYTWPAAVADTSYYNTKHQTMQTSICPSGWHIPSGGNKDNFANSELWQFVRTAIGANPADYESSNNPYYQGSPEGTNASDILRSYPNNFIYSGVFSDNSPANRSVLGAYWSSTVNTSVNSYNLIIRSNEVHPGINSNNKRYGLSIRCVASDPPAPANTVQYNPNGSDVEGTMGNQTMTSSDTSLTLLASNFSRTGYGFAGWSPDKNVTTSSKIYGPQEDITFTAGTYATEGLKLYAVWVPSQGSLQDTSKVASVCNNLTTAPTNGTANISSVSALTDQRDNQTYAIAKLADDKCWMIENLRLNNDATGNSDGSLAQGYHSSFIGLADPETTDKFSSTYSANSLYSINSYRMPRYSNINTSARASSPTTNSVAMYSYGNYYTWPAAIADTTAYDSDNTSVTNTSICPSGWHLPIGGSSANATNSEFWQLGLGIMGAAPSDNLRYTSSETNAAGKTAIDAFRSYPNNFVYSGQVNSGSVFGRSYYGEFWSSTAVSYNRAYYLYLFSSVVRPGTNYDDKYSGKTVRCVASGV